MFTNTCIPFIRIKTLVFALILAVTALSAKTAAAGERHSMNSDWLFHLGDVFGAEGRNYDDSGWRCLNVPHDWSIEQVPERKAPGANGFFPGGTGWYRKQFFAPAQWRDRKAFIEFDGVYMNSDVYLNGHLLGHRPYGYVRFQYDLSPWLMFGATNCLAVRVDHSEAPTSRWYSGSGIYRHVWLEVTAPLHVAHWGVWVTTSCVSKRSAEVRIDTTLLNEGGGGQLVDLQTDLIDANGQIVASTLKNCDLGLATNGVFCQTLRVSHPMLWSPENPYCYVIRTTVKSKGFEVDGCETTFGIRTTDWSTRGFCLNGEPVKLKGVCLHQDAGCLGVAVPLHVWERRLAALKAIGCNALRMSHNPPAPEVLDLCDRFGFLVLDEAFDKWKSGYYGKYFDTWWQPDLNAMLLRDRNHPSVVLWSVGNEVAEQGKTEGTRMLKMLVDHVRQMDPTRPVTCAAHPDRGADSCVNAHGFYQPLDVVSYNYQEQWFEADHRQFPRRIMLSTESYPYFRGRADYHTTNQLHNGYCDFSPLNPWWDVKNNKYVAGQFLWVGIDYLGESKGWPSRGWPGGLLDTCGWPKPFAGFYRCAWGTAPAVQIMVLDDTLKSNDARPAWSWPHMVAHWNFSNYNDRVIRVDTPSNCEKVELLLNDKSLGVRRPADYPNGTIPWYLDYQPGKLRAVGFNGECAVCSDQLHTAGPAARLKLLPDRQSIVADGEDVACIEARIVDEHDRLVPDRDQLLKFSIKGPGKILGVDNGDLGSLESYQGSQHITQGGRVLVVVQSMRQGGEIELAVTADGLPQQTTTVHSRP